MHRLRVVARFVQANIGWNRIGLALSLAIIGTASFVLYRTLRGIDVREVILAIETTRPHKIVLATLFVAAGYFTLTFYDLFALRTVGKPHVPYRVAALAGFTSYAVGHNIGAVRYRTYSLYGLSAIDVAKLCFIAGLTFWLGNATVLGLGILYTPRSASAIDQLPIWFNRTLAVVVLISLASYVAWVWQTPRRIGHSTWVVTLPNGPLTLLQIAIGITDLGFCALAMYMLLPVEPYIGFTELAVIFVSATLLGFASHSPGGLGVFDAAMLVALWQYDKEDLLAGVLLFRLLYYILPFAVALGMLGARELWLGWRRPKIEPIKELTSDERDPL
jgi:glycosyltransferase 2 family protein